MLVTNQLKSVYNRPFKDSHSHPIHICFPIIASNRPVRTECCSCRVNHRGTPKSVCIKSVGKRDCILCNKHKWYKNFFYNVCISNEFGGTTELSLPAPSGFSDFSAFKVGKMLLTDGPMHLAPPLQWEEEGLSVEGQPPDSQPVLRVPVWRRGSEAGRGVPHDL